MYIRRLVLKGIKGFDDADLPLAPDGTYQGWSVITGDNGSGKTALLKAISLALLGPELVRTLVPDMRGWIMEGRESGTISVEVKPDHDIDKMRRGQPPVRSTFWAEIEIKRDGPLYEASSADIYRNKKQSATNGPWQQSTQGWFSVGYGPFRRLYGSSPDAQRLMMLPGRIPRFATLFKEDATLAEAEEWVKQLNYRKLESREAERITLDALLTLLGEDFLREGMSIEKVDSDGIWLRDSAGHLMPLTDMSEGYRSALAMLIDIFRHMVDVYGGQNILNARDDGTHFVTKPGVVMIDEVDAHLHPAWQREIGFWLKKHFPFVQFLVTTHSPLVCQAADNGRIYHLPQPGKGEPFIIAQEQYNQIIRGKPDEILLSPAFGMPHTRSPRAVSARFRHARLAAKKQQGVLNSAEILEMEQLSLFVE